MLSRERQSARMSKIKNGGLDQYGAGPFEQQQFGTAGVEVVKPPSRRKTEHMYKSFGPFLRGAGPQLFYGGLLVRFTVHLFANFG